MIKDTIQYGKLLRKQGMKFYVMLEKGMPGEFSSQYREKVNNVVVIVSNDGVIVTVYKDEHAYAHLRKKQKRLSGRGNRVFHHKTFCHAA